MTNKHKCETNQEILFYCHEDFKDFCKECQEKLYEKYRYNYRDDRFWLEQIEQLRFNHFKLIEFVKDWSMSHLSDLKISEMGNSAVGSNDYEIGKNVKLADIVFDARELLREIGELS